MDEVSLDGLAQGRELDARLPWLFENRGCPSVPSVSVEVPAQHNHQVNVLADIPFCRDAVGGCATNPVANEVQHLRFTTFCGALAWKEPGQMGDHPVFELADLFLREHAELFVPDREPRRHSHKCSTW